MTAERTGEVARAKVNLFLHVTGQRADGYHELESLVVFPAIGDHLMAAPADGLSLTVAGPFAAALMQTPTEDNLVLRAARALADRVGGARGAALRLEKNLPVASGVGGGSADAGAALRLLSRLWRAPAGAAAAVAPGLGADAPMCLRSRAAMAAGAGERLNRAPRLPAFALLLANPLTPLATPEVFARLQRRDNPSAPAAPDGFDSAAALAGWLAAQRNDLEAPARALCPEVSDLLSLIAADPACLLARMSGSGATCFGIYADKAGAETAARRLRAARPDWWVAAAAVTEESDVDDA